MSTSNNTNIDILVAGAVAALSIDLLVYPLDTIKTRIQSPDYKKLYTNVSTGAVQRSLFRGLYQGVGSVVLATVPSSGAFFTTYEGTKSLLTRLNPTTNSNKPLIPIPIIHSAASCVGELVSCFILTPAEVLKQNAQVVKRSTTDSSHAFDTNATRQAFKKFKKPTQLWRGYTALAARNLPFTAMQFPMFEHLKKSIMEYRQEHNTATGTLLEKAVVTGLSAGSAGSVAAVITTPIDVVKTRIMLGAASEEGGVAGEAARSAMKQVEAQGKDAKAELERAQQAAKAGRGGGFAVGKEILRTEGVKGLFRGGALRGAWTALGSGLYLSVYESGRTYLEGRRREKDDGRAVV